MLAAKRGTTARILRHIGAISCIRPFLHVPGRSYVQSEEPEVYGAAQSRPSRCENFTSGASDCGGDSTEPAFADHRFELVVDKAVSDLLRPPWAECVSGIGHPKAANPRIIGGRHLSFLLHFAEQRFAFG